VPMAVAFTAVAVTFALAAVSVTVAFMAVTMVAAVTVLAIIVCLGGWRRRRPRPLASAGEGAIRIVAASAVGEPAGTAFLAVPGELRRDLLCGLRRVLQAGGSRKLIIGKVLREGIGLRCGRHAQGDRRRGSKCCKKAFHCIS
jgi:hypothetical protein